MLAVENGALFPYYKSIRRKNFMLIAMDHGNKQCLSLEKYNPKAML